MGLKETILGIKKPLGEDQDIHDVKLVKVYSPDNEIDLAFLKGILEGEDIPYFVHNDHFGSLRVGFIIELLNQKTIFVEKSYEAQARGLIMDFIEITRTEFEKYSMMDKIRMFFEAIFIDISVPGKGWKKGFPKEDFFPIIIWSAVFISIMFLMMWLLKQVMDYFHYRFYW